jgi:hypothetical protein
MQRFVEYVRFCSYRGEDCSNVRPDSRGTCEEESKKEEEFEEELIAYSPFTRHEQHEKDASDNSSLPQESVH